MRFGTGRATEETVVTMRANTRTRAIRTRPSTVVVAMVVTVACALATTAGTASATGGYPDADAVDCSASFGVYSWCKGGTWLSGRGYAYRNCTDFVAWKLQSLGVPDTRTRGLGNANTWDDRAPGKGVAVNGAPAVGSVAISNAGSFGHIAFVEWVNGGQITVSEYNRAGNGAYGTRSSTPAALGFTVFAHFEAFMSTPPSGGAAEHDVNGDGRADLTLVATGDPTATGSGRLEAHVLNGATGYSSWLGNWATAAGYGNGSNRYVMGDVNGDGRADLALIATGDPNPTGSGRLDVHVLNGATGYSSWLGNWATAAGYGNGSNRYVMGDVNGDGRADLALIGTGPTGSGRTEVHVLDGATGFSTWLAHWATPAGYGNASTRYVMGDVNGDGRADLTLIGTGPTGSGRLEAHVLSGATGYSTWLGNWATAAGYLSASDQVVMGDVNGDDRADLVIVGVGPTGSGRTEAHVLDGVTGFSTWLAHWATAAGYGGSGTAYVMS
jgi:surface antigen